MVTGYTTGTLNPVTGLLEVRNSDAHAWVEVFFPGTGWVEFEPTPGFPDTADLGGPVTRRWVLQDLAAALHAGLSRLASRYPAVERWLSAGAVAADAASRTLPWFALALAIGVAAVATLRVAGFGAAPKTPLASLEEVHRQMSRLLARRGLSRVPGETIAEFSRRLRAHHGLEEVGPISEAVESVVYGGQDPHPDLVRAAQGHLERLRDRLRRRRGTPH
jgi:transglutaminase-like putative cysteine protease